MEISFTDLLSRLMWMKKPQRNRNRNPLLARENSLLFVRLSCRTKSEKAHIEARQGGERRGFVTPLLLPQPSSESVHQIDGKIAKRNLNEHLFIKYTISQAIRQADQ